MASKETKYFRGKYYQGTLTDEQAGTLLTLVTEYDQVTSLTNAIVNLPAFVITDIINDAEVYEKEHGSLKGFFKDYSEHIAVGELRKDQTMGVAFMYYAGSCLLGDEVGLGKTVQIAGLVNVLKKEYASRGKTFRYCFLTEKSSSGQIREKLVQFTGEFVGLIESGEKAVVERYLSSNQDQRYYSVVGSHSLMTNPTFVIEMGKRPFDLIIVDESSIAKNAQSDFYKNCKTVFKRTERKILLNATPLETDLRDFYNQLDLVDPTMLPSLTEFNRLFTKVKPSRFGRFEKAGYKNEEYFREAISLRYYARTREELGAVYEDNTYKTILVPLSPEQKRLMKKTTMYRMVTDYPTGIDKNVEFNEYTTPKLAVLSQIVDEAVGVYQNQVLVYCNFVKAQEDLAQYFTDKGYRVAMLNGQGKTRSAKVRTEVVADFNDGHYDILLTNVLKGLDLKTCDNSVLYTIDPNPQKMVQFEGRITREFDVIGKNLYLLVAVGKEKKFVEETLKLRVKASASFSKTGGSMVISAIGSDDDSNKEMFFSNSYTFGGDDDDE